METEIQVATPLFCLSRLSWSFPSYTPPSHPQIACIFTNYPLCFVCLKLDNLKHLPVMRGSWRIKCCWDYSVLRLQLPAPRPVIEEGAILLPRSGSGRSEWLGVRSLPPQTRFVFLKKACHEGQSALPFPLFMPHIPPMSRGVQSSVYMQTLLSLLPLRL